VHLPVYLAQNDVESANDGDDVRNKLPATHQIQRL
jgi:hypothetical protein